MPVAYPEIPDKISVDLDLRRLSAAAAFQRRMWGRAADLLNETYEYLLQQQEEYDARFHKGWELHNGGIALLRLGRPQEGIDRILLAYVEDALSLEAEEEAAIDDTLAGRTLQSAGTSPDLLMKIKKLARQRKPHDIPRDPKALLDQALFDRNEEVRMGTQSALVYFIDEWAAQILEGRTIDRLEPYERRCFVGGSYRRGPNIDEIIRIVRDEGFDAVVADEFELGPRGVHHHSLLLLHLCPKAVFEVTIDAGHLMELERCRDYDIEPLLVRNTRAGQPADVSEMIRSMAGVRKVYPYSSIEQELRPIIHDYLHNLGDWAPQE